jgi:hypothetical protein
MAKDVFRVGDIVRLTSNFQVGDIKIRKTTMGKIKAIKGGMFSKKYVIRWNGTNFDMTMENSRNFVSAQVADGGVYKD